MASEGHEQPDGVEVLETDRRDLTRTRVERSPRQPLDPGEVRLGIDHFALTSNNATYARLGDELGYWELFPALPPWGRVPAWGHLVATESRVAGIEVGDRFHGLVPMATEVTLSVGAAGGHGFTRVHRGAAAYRFYRRLSTDGLEEADLWRQTLLRPLFITSFVLDRDHARRHASTGVVLTSASSRTAIGTAYLLTGRGVPVTGLTSARHVATLRGLGCYTQVLSYDDLATDPTALRVRPGEQIVCDFAGSARIRAHLGAALGGSLAAWIRIGDLRESGDGAPDEGERFFAPDVIAAQARDLGPAAFDAELEQALDGITAWSGEWLAVDAVRDAGALGTAWRSALDGGIGPTGAVIATLGSLRRADDSRSSPD